MLSIGKILFTNAIVSDYIEKQRIKITCHLVVKRIKTAEKEKQYSQKQKPGKTKSKIKKIKNNRIKNTIN